MDPLTILYEDEHLIAVSKPCGQPTIPARGSPTLPLSEQIAEYTKGRIWIIHRLDQETSGVVLFAKDALTHRKISLQFERRQTHKTYLALVEGQIESPGEIDSPLKIFGSGRVGIADNGKPSMTRFAIREKFKGATLLEVSPVSGRRHQIRVHFHSIGHPVLGDPRYGRKRPVGGVSRLMLHAYEIEFTGPKSKKLKLRAEPPPDFLKVLDEWRHKS